MAMRYIQIFSLFFLLLLTQPALSFAQGTRIQVALSEQNVYLDEVLYLTYSISGNSSGVRMQQPRLDDFTLLGTPHQSTSYEVVVVNGNMSRETITNFTYALRAKRTGTFRIQGAGVRTQSGQTINAAAATVTVKPGKRSQRTIEDEFAELDRRQQQMAQQMRDMMRGMDPEPAPQRQPQANYQDFTLDKIDNNIFLKAEVDNLNPVVGEQVNVTYKLYTRLQMNMRPVALPQLNGFWAQDQEITDPGTPHQENYKGKVYNVFTLRKTALFPQQSGTLRLDPFKASGWVNVFERGNGGYYEQKVNKELASDVVQLSVAPLPEPDASFSNGVGNFTISSQVSQTQLSTDDVIQLVFTVTGTGNLGLITAPRLALPPGLSAVDPEIKDNIAEIMPKLEGTRQFTYNITADTAGTYNIPEIAFTYFDVGTKVYKTLKTQAFTVNVRQGSNNKPSGNAGNNTEMRDIHPIQTGIPGFNGSGTYALHQWYYWLVFSLPLMAIAGLLFAGKRKRGMRNTLYQPAANKIAEKRLGAAKEALGKQQITLFYEEISKAIWLYLSDQLGIPLSNLNKVSVVEALRSRHFPEQTIESTLQHIEDCELALYTPSAGQQQQQALDKAIALIAALENQFNQKS
ncbi:MAG: protein BatD [Sphingobacteriales bacterium]|nr:MAG: protein BatD [Sphingobacteriales bacterium]